MVNWGICNACAPWGARAIEVARLGYVGYGGLGRTIWQYRRTAFRERRAARDGGGVSALTENSPDLIDRFDADFRHVYVNRAGLKILGLPREAVIGRTIRQTNLPEPWCSLWEERLATVFQTGQPLDVEDSFPDATSGDQRFFSSRCVPEFSPDGVVATVLVVSRDITDRRRQEEELRHAKYAAETANAAKDQFLAVLSHELRTPLTPVLLSASELERRDDVPADVRGELRMIHQAVQLEARIIDDLLDVTRIARGKMKFDFTLVDVHQVVRAAAGICSEGNGAPISLHLHGRRHMVWGDAARLQQVFWNLLNNSRKFAPATGRITVRCGNAGDDKVRIEVIDTGAGIQASDLPRIFDAFVQGDLPRVRQHGGLGLGLAICKTIVEAHLGSIGAYSDGPERGAIFTVNLPVHAARSCKAAVPPEPAPPRIVKPLRILVVEDHEPTLRVLGQLVESLGHYPTLVGNVRAALEASSLNDFDLVISDLGLPDGTGHDLMRELKHLHGLSGIALSGHGMEDDVRRSEEAGFRQHLTKPIDFEQLENAIGRVSE